MGRPSKVRDKAAERKKEKKVVMLNIRNLCELYGVKEAELAQLTNMSLRTYKKKAAAETLEFSGDELQIFAQELHVNTSSLFVMPVYPVEPIEL